MTNRPAHCLKSTQSKRYARTGQYRRCGAEPVAVAERNGNEIWVVNHLSDSVSGGGLARVAYKILQVGDRPRDVCLPGPIATVLCDCSVSRLNHFNLTSASPPQPGQGRAEFGLLMQRISTTVLTAIR